jgi:hypothetical protein
MFEALFFSSSVGTVCTAVGIFYALCQPCNKLKVNSASSWSYYTANFLMNYLIYETYFHLMCPLVSFSFHVFCRFIMIVRSWLDTDIPVTLVDIYI